MKRLLKYLVQACIQSPINMDEQRPNNRQDSLYPLVKVIQSFNYTVFLIPAAGELCSSVFDSLANMFNTVCVCLCVNITEDFFSYGYRLLNEMKKSLFRPI